MYVGVEENEFNNNAVVKKSFMELKKIITIWHSRNSSMGKMRYKDITKKNHPIF